MSDSRLHGFEYFVLRCMPRVDRGEFVNVGLVLHCQEFDFLEAACRVDAARVRALDPDVDLDQVKAHLKGVEAVCRGDAAAGPPAELSRRQRFDWLASPRSTVVQPGPVHSGLTGDPAAELQRLLGALVQ